MKAQPGPSSGQPVPRPCREVTLARETPVGSAARGTVGGPRPDPEDCCSVPVLRRSALLPLLLAPVALVAPAATGAASGADEAPPPAERAASLGLPLGHDRIGLRRGDTWYLRPDLDRGPAQVVREHVAGWVPVAGDTDGDGTGTVSLFKDGVWRVSDGPGRLVRTFAFGLKGDLPVVGDWNADGIDTVGVYRAGRFYLRDTITAGPYRVVGFGVPGDVPVVGDWDGDGGTDIGVKRGSTWFQRDASDAGAASRSFRFGLAGDLPVAGDWDHDGKDTVAAFRAGTWFLRDAGGTYQTTRFGVPGDRPVVRRTQGLAPGVSHRVLRDPAGFVAHVVTVAMDQVSTPDVVLATDHVPGTETTSSMGRRSGAVVAVNGDYATSDGRPVHALARDGELALTSSLPGKAIGLDLGAVTATSGAPTIAMSAQPDGLEPLPLTAWNDGQPDGDQVVGFTSAGAPVETPRSNACYAGVAAGRTVVRDGVLETATTLTGRRCFGDPAQVPDTGALLTTNTYAGRQGTFESMTAGQGVTLRKTLGFAGSVDLLGGNPMLVVDGAVPSADVDQSGGFFGPNPRTAVGTTADGTLLLVVVDGRRPGYSTGATMRQLADLMVSLGARHALNLDGGGSTTLWLNGTIANRPSDGAERGVSSALVVLPAGDPGEVGLAAVSSGAARRARTDVTPTVAVRAETGPADSAARAQRDPASTGGLEQLR